MSKPMNICMDCVNNFFDKKKNRYYCADNKTRIEDVPCVFFEQRCDDNIDNPWHTGTPTEHGNYLCVFDDSNTPLYGWCIWDGKWHYLSGYDPYVYHMVAWMPIPPYETKPHITKLPKEWYDPAEDDWYNESQRKG